MKHLTFKVQVTPEQSAKIQQAIFEKGGRWMDDDTHVKYQGKTFLVVRSGMITSTDSESLFLNLDLEIPQWFAHQALQLIKNIRLPKENTPISPAYIVDDRGATVAIRKNTSVRPAMLYRNTPGLAHLWTLGDTNRYSQYSGATTLYENQYRDEILKEAYKLCAELNNQKGED